MTAILCTGIATLDIINRVDHYPREDEELRAIAQSRRTGGNAANTARVLAQLEHPTSLLAVFAADAEGRWLQQDLHSHGIKLNASPVLQGTTPTSYITLNAQTGSRTIVHYRDLPELPETAFDAITVSAFDWLHFEGRNPSVLASMLRQARSPYSQTKISLEVEKPRAGIESVFELADVLMFSKDYALKSGSTSAAQLLQNIAGQYPDKQMTCTWGDGGAYFYAAGGTVGHIAAKPCQTVVETLAAGDTFNAGLIHRLSQGKDLAEAVNFASALAARKITQEGLAQLQECNELSREEDPGSTAC